MSGCPRAMAGGGRHPLDRAFRRRARLPAPAPRADPAGPARRGRLVPGRQDVGPRARQRLRRALRRPAAEPDRAGRPGRLPRRAGDRSACWARWRPRRSSCWPPGSAPWSRDQEAGRWSAVVTAALTTSPLIDPVAAKGELLALPLRGAGAAGGRCSRCAPGAGPGAGLRLRRRAGRRVGARTEAEPRRRPGVRGGAVPRLVGVGLPTGRRAGLAAHGALLAAGAAVPVLATVGWAAGAGVRLSELWYTVYGFRSDAAQVIAREHEHQAGGADRAAAGHRDRRRRGRDRRRVRRALPGALDGATGRSRWRPGRC